MSVRSYLRPLLFTVLTTATLTAQTSRENDIPLRNWAVPLYWQPTPLNTHDAVAQSGIQSDVPPSRTTRTNSRLVFVGMTPCRVVDTRLAANGFPGAFGPPSLQPGATRTFALQSSSLCTIPAKAKAYSLNITTVPPGSRSSLRIWPTGQPMPEDADASIVPVGTDGSVDVACLEQVDVVIDINGYYVSPRDAGDSLWNIAANGSDIYFDTGNVGIGTETPGQNLEVNGVAKFDSGIMFGDGTVQTTASGGTITAVNAGPGLIGGGTSGAVTLGLDTTQVPQLNAANAFVGNQSITGNLNVTGTAKFSGGVTFADGTTQATAPRSGVTWLSVRDFGAVGDGTTNDTKAIQSTINQVLSAGGGVVYLPPGKYLISSQLKIDGSNIALQGAGKDATTIFGGVPVDWSISAISTTMKTNIEIRDLTVDVNNGVRASGIQVAYVNGFALRRCRIQNVATAGWNVSVGASSGATDTVMHTLNVVVEDSDFINHAGTLEELLVFNTANIKISRSTFSNFPGGPALGFWQNDDNVTVEDSTFTSGGTALYYSQTTNNLVFRNLNMSSVTSGIHGANQSDNGSFGATTVRNVQILGGAYSGTGDCVQLGAVDGASVIGVRFYHCGGIGMYINSGNSPVNYAPANIRILGCEFVENNQSATLFGIHPGLLISASVQNLLIAGNTFSDEQATPTQQYPITADGAITATNVIISGNRLTPYGSAPSVAALDGATFASSYAFANSDYKASAAIPSGLSATKTIKGSDGNNCTLTITSGIITATTCP